MIPHAPPRSRILNVRPAGLSLDATAFTQHQWLPLARLKQLTGVGLKVDTHGLVWGQAGDHSVVIPSHQTTQQAAAQHTTTQQ